ncbi:amidohydrolase family protein [Jiangella alkaliphila]|uniref:Predicted metal-dependent hydrolase, TIM-barrel fold n=1 Tax=Jiangella alkaliphila TaxID=419479 RepID=A0A1H2JRT7_9ACTN|nr:amidohydrolase family protein [Jiangella alkaliphila]SDU59229.1 Predicted metal-dependent hydrolase, TIM-barrel fold [Jiangella alkaliphila]
MKWEHVLDLDIVDAHHHLWDLARSYPWLQETAGELQVHGDDAAIRRDYLVDDFRRDAEPLRLVASVHVDAGAADPLEEARWLQQVADESGYPQAIVAGARLDAGDVDEVLDELAALPNVRGVRHILNWHPDPAMSYTDRPDLITDPAWLAGFARLAHHGLSFDLQVYPAQLAEAAQLAAGHPDTMVVLNHAGMPLGRDPDSLLDWRRGLDALAARPNTAVKISGLGMTDHRWTLGSLRPVVLECIEAFGADRAMFASNFPVDGLYSTYAQLYDAFDTITADFSAGERAALFAGTARRVYGLADRAAPA